MNDNPKPTARWWWTSAGLLAIWILLSLLLGFVIGSGAAFLTR